MNLFQSSRMRVADAVLDEIKKLQGGSVYVEAYVNGREHGYCLYNINRKVAFSEDRSSDDINVYLGASSDFSMQGNVPNERAYYSRLVIPRGDHQRAARAIHNWLMDGKQCTDDPGENAIVLHRDPPKLVFDKRASVQGWNVDLDSKQGLGEFYYGAGAAKRHTLIVSSDMVLIGARLRPGDMLDPLPVGVLLALDMIGVKYGEQYRTGKWD